MRQLFHVQGLLLFLPLSAGQLLGHFGFKKLPDGFQYRDFETVEAAKFAVRFQEQVNDRADNKRRAQSIHMRKQTPSFQKQLKEVKIGTEFCDCKIFDIFDTVFVNPVAKTATRVFIVSFIYFCLVAPIGIAYFPIFVVNQGPTQSQKV